MGKGVEGWDCGGGGGGVWVLEEVEVVIVANRVGRERLRMRMGVRWGEEKGKGKGGRRIVLCRLVGGWVWSDVWFWLL